MSQLLKPPADSRSALARMIDFTMVLLLAWLLVGFFYIILMPNFKPAHGLLILLVVAITYAMIRYRQYRQVKQQHKATLWLTRQKIRAGLHHITCPKKFSQVVKELLVSTGAFTNLQLVPEGQSLGVDLVGYVRQYPVGVYCLHTEKPDQIISAQQVALFLRTLETLKFRHGVMVTTGEFVPLAHQVARSNMNTVAIRLLNGSALIQMAQKYGYPLLTDDHRPPEQDHYTGRRLALLIKNNLLASRRKMLLYTTLGLCFLVISRWQTGLNEVIYIIFGMANLLLGLAGLALTYWQQKDAVLKF